MKIENYRRFGGTVPEAATVHNLLAGLDVKAPHSGEPYSEAFIFGLGGGIAFGTFLFEYAGMDPTVYIGTRYQWHDSAAFIDTVVRALGGLLVDTRTGSPATAKKHLEDALAAGNAVIVGVDAALLRHNGMPANMEGSLSTVVSVCGLDGGRVTLDDRASMPVELFHKELQDARARIKKLKNAAITIAAPETAPELAPLVQSALRQFIARGLNPGINVKAFRNNFGLAGLRRWEESVNDATGARGWRRVFQSDAALYGGMKLLHYHLAYWSSDGSACRDLFAQWLSEAGEILESPGVTAAADSWKETAQVWRETIDALFPPSIDLFARTREAMQRRKAAFTARGTAAMGEIMREVNTLTELQQECLYSFKLSEAEREHFLAEAGAAVRRLVAAEERSFQLLADAL